MIVGGSLLEDGAWNTGGVRSVRVCEVNDWFGIRYFEIWEKLKRVGPCVADVVWMLFGGTWWWIFGPDGGQYTSDGRRRKGMRNIEKSVKERLLALIDIKCCEKD